MGRKKRHNNNNGGDDPHHNNPHDSTEPYPQAPHTLFQDASKRLKQSSEPQPARTAEAVAPNTKIAPPPTESYLVKKYRPDKHYASMDAFVRYTKAHRMLDAAYVRWNNGATAEKPFVFATRVGGTELGWGRGKTREAAMDCACRATFALVNAHGYKNFTLDEDCMLEAPPPPPPPPPLPTAGYPAMMPLPVLPPPPGAVFHSLPPPHLPVGQNNNYLPVPPHGAFVPPPPYPPPMQPDMIIPQPKLPDSTVAVASMTRMNQQLLSNDGETSTTPAISLNLTGTVTATSTATATTQQHKLKGGLQLMYIHFNEESNEGSTITDEYCAEEVRAQLPSYQKMLLRATMKSGGDNL